MGKQMGVAAFLHARYKYPTVWPPLLGFPGIVGVEIKVQTQGASGSSRGRLGHCSDPSPPGGGAGEGSWAPRSEAKTLGGGGRCSFTTHWLWGQAPVPRMTTEAKGSVPPGASVGKLETRRQCSVHGQTA